MANKKTIKIKKAKRINKKHFIIFNNGGVISATTPKDWARAHQELFNVYDFSDSDNTPTVAVIERELLRIGFTEIKNNEIVIFYEYKSL
jgi:hypothetical protein